MTTYDLNIKFTAGAESAYAELPVDAAYLRWTRGDAKLAVIKDADPARYFGGWRANVKNRDGEDLPSLPLPVVERVSQDGKKTFLTYSHNYINFLPLAHRTRFEKRETVTDPSTGEERTKVVAISNQKAPGYAPNKQVFGLVFGDDGSYSPAVLVLDKWSSFINFNKAEGKWSKLKVPNGKALVRKYGTVGETDKTSGRIVPVFETFGQSLSTPIDAVDLSHPVLVDVTEDIAKLYYESTEWADCPRWHKVGGDQDDLSAKSKFLARANELNLSSIDIEQLLAENSNDYLAALKAIEANEPVTESEDFQF